MSRSSIPLVLAAAAALSCSGDPTGPEVAVCDSRHGAEVCADRAEYERSETVEVTTRNVSSRPIFQDVCSTKLVGVTSLVRAFEEDFNPRLRCGNGATAEDVRANMVRIEPGESYTENLEFTLFAFQGYYRANVWILDEEGQLVAETPAHTGIFRVFPSSSG